VLKEVRREGGEIIEFARVDEIAHRLCISGMFDARYSRFMLLARREISCKIKLA